MLVQGMHIHSWKYLILKKHKTEHSHPELGDKQQKLSVGPFAKLRKEIVSFFMSVRMEQKGLHWTDLDKI
jgi:hypothetical protein